MFSSNEQKQRKYLKLRKLEEQNMDAQQDKLDEQLALEKGLDTQATSYARMAKRVVNAFGEDITTPMKNTMKDGVNSGIVSATDYLRGAIKNGTLSQLFDKIKALPTKNLTKLEKIIQSDIKNPVIKTMVNDAISEALPEGELKVSQAVIDTLGGGNEEAVLGLVNKASRSSSNASDNSVGSTDSTMKQSTIADFVKYPEFEGISATLDTTIPKLSDKLQYLKLFNNGNGKEISPNKNLYYGLSVNNEGLSFHKRSQKGTYNPITYNELNKALKKNNLDINLGRLTKDLVELQNR